MNKNANPSNLQAESVLLAQDRKIGFGRLRLRPKNRGLRPIVNMSSAGYLRISDSSAAEKSTIPIASSSTSRPGTLQTQVAVTAPTTSASALSASATSSTSGAQTKAKSAQPTTSTANAGIKKFIPVNLALRNTFNVLKWEKERKPGLLGVSIFGSNEIYTKFKQFLLQVKALRASRIQQSSHSSASSIAEQLPKDVTLYLVSTDLKHCFDTINRNKLMDVIQKVITEECYSLERYSGLYGSAGRLRSKEFRLVSPSGELPSFFSVAEEKSLQYHNAVFTDGVTKQYTDRKGLLDLLQQHIYQNIIRINGQYFHQVDGIPQGSILSSLLCCMFLGHMERSGLVPRVLSCQHHKVANTGTAFDPNSRPSATFARSLSTPNRPVIQQTSTATQGVPATEVAATTTTSTATISTATISTAAIPSRPPSLRRSRSDSVRKMRPLKRSRKAPKGEKHAHLLLRQMDDYLYVTTSEASAQEFKQSMHDVLTISICFLTHFRFQPFRDTYTLPHISSLADLLRL